jgi:predicted amidophosphoribosyltransferase
MDLDLKKISKAWFDSWFGGEEQKSLANKRLNICNSCPKRTELIKGFPTICGECGCPLSKKIFSSTFNDCPLNKWESVDNEHPKIFNKKLL